MSHKRSKEWTIENSGIKSSVRPPAEGVEDIDERCEPGWMDEGTVTPLTTQLRKSHRRQASTN